MKLTVQKREKLELEKLKTGIKFFFPPFLTEISEINPLPNCASYRQIARV